MKQRHNKETKKMELRLTNNVSGIFFRICWCGVSYPTLLFLPICIGFSIMNVTKQIWAYSYKELEIGMITFLVCTFMLIVALWIFKRFPIKLTIDNEVLTLYYALPFVKLRYNTNEIKYEYKIGNMGLNYGKSFQIKTKMDLLPIAIMSPIYQGDWNQIQDFVHEFNKSQKQK